MHPLHIAVKRNFTDCIEYLMGCELPPQKVKDELAWAVQYDLTHSVMALLRSGAPHGLRVLAPWTATIPRALSAWDYSLPLSYYMVMCGWHVPQLMEVLARGWTDLQAQVADADDQLRTVAAVAAVEGSTAEALAEKAKPYNTSLLHLAVYSGALDLVGALLRKSSAERVHEGDCFQRRIKNSNICSFSFGFQQTFFRAWNSKHISKRTQYHILLFRQINCFID